MRLLTWTTSLALSAVVFVACQAQQPGGRDGDSDSDADLGDADLGDADLGDTDLGDVDGDSDDTGAGGASNECKSTLVMTYRDFKGATEVGGHPDFERSDFQGDNAMGCGIVQTALGEGTLPVFFGPYGSGKRQLTNTNGVDTFTGCQTPWDYTPQMPQWTVLSADSFSTWYTDSDYSIKLTGELVLVEEVEGSGQFAYDSNTTSGFFPIDNQGFGNTPGQAHNFSFTSEAHTKFGYVAGQKFTFRGDDDLWIFINTKLAMDLGGMHGPIAGTIDFDAQASALGISPGQTYQMDIYHAERHTSGSNFRVETNIKCFEPVVVVR